MRLLVVEDDPRLREAIVDTLMLKGHEVCEAPNGVEAIAIVRSQNLDLVLSDINMPGMSGLDAFAKLAEKIETKSIPVVALSADAMGADVKKAMDIGFHSYITKPIDVANFLQCMTRILE